MNMDAAARRAIAHKCGIGYDYLYQVLTGRKKGTAELCIQIEKATSGVVRCEDLRPDVDWAYLRSTANTVPKGADHALPPLATGTIANV